MFCPKCGTSNDDNLWRCTNCSTELHAPGSRVAARPPSFSGVNSGDPLQAYDVRDYLVQSILVTLFCCLPLGIPAIVYAAQTRTKRDAGDLAGAAEASKNARLWCWLGFGLGLGAGLLYILAIVMMGIGGSM
ncbi:MAG: CD225/dispanin family protein [Ignavibacteria bacterium]|nr:CD225/dispanin family protein [Ignavibacteria bacterium]